MQDPLLNQLCRNNLLYSLLLQDLLKHLVALLFSAGLVRQLSQQLVDHHSSVVQLLLNQVQDHHYLELLLNLSQLLEDLHFLEELLQLKLGPLCLEEQQSPLVRQVCMEELLLVVNHHYSAHQLQLNNNK